MSPLTLADRTLSPSGRPRAQPQARSERPVAFGGPSLWQVAQGDSGVPTPDVQSVVGHVVQQMREHPVDRHRLGIFAGQFQASFVRTECGRKMRGQLGCGSEACDDWGFNDTNLGDIAEQPVCDF